MASHPPRYTGQPSPGASIPLPVTGSGWAPGEPLIPQEIIDHIRGGTPLTTEEVASCIDHTVSLVAVARELRGLGFEKHRARLLNGEGTVVVWRVPELPRRSAADFRRTLLEADRAPPFAYEHGKRATEPQPRFGIFAALASVFGKGR